MGFNDKTIAVPPELKDKIKSMKIIEDETYPNVLKRIIQEAEKVPALEKEIKTLHETIVGNLLDENNYLKEIEELKQNLDSMKVDKETQEDVVWRLKEQAEKVPVLEKRVQELEEKIRELDGENV